MLPSIYRNKADTGFAREIDRTARFNILEEETQYLLSKCEENQWIPKQGISQMKRFPELSWAVLQHYEICPTPVLDVTQSLRVAASFYWPRR